MILGLQFSDRLDGKQSQAVLVSDEFEKPHVAFLVPFRHHFQTIKLPNQGFPQAASSFPGTNKACWAQLLPPRHPQRSLREVWDLKNADSIEELGPWTGGKS